MGTHKWKPFLADNAVQQLYRCQNCRFETPSPDMTSTPAICAAVSPDLECICGDLKKPMYKKSVHNGIKCEYIYNFYCPRCEDSDPEANVDRY